METRRAFSTTVGALAVGGITALSGCNGESAADPTPTATTTDAPDPSVTMNGTNAAGQLYFSPIGLHVPPGTTVTWQGENGQHSTHAFHPDTGTDRRIPEGAEPWSSPVISYGSFEHTFEVEGTYDYYCGVHYNHAMVGRIVVGEPGGPADDGRTPYGPVPPADEIVERGRIPHSDFPN